jgi:16S rRNA (adenine1518-N6/adenine1519-N6)-dimethyltransferase
LLRIRLHSEPRVPVADQARFFAVVHAGFSQKRKQVHNSLVHALHLPYEVISAALAEAEIAPDRRPQMLSIEEWARLAHALAGWLS